LQGNIGAQTPDASADLTSLKDERMASNQARLTGPACLKKSMESFFSISVPLS
jgi:hypothetical protein